MKKTFTLTFALIGLLINQSIAQNLTWAKSMGGNNYEEGYDIAVDKQLNVYTTGYFRNTVDFDPGVGVANLSSAGGYDIFIQKLNASGELVWAKSIGGLSNNDFGYAIAVDNDGNVYATGTFSETVDFNPGVGVDEMTGGSMADIFIVKLDVSGNFVWAKIMGGSHTDMGKSIEVDSKGNVYTTGAFTGTVDFDPGIQTYNMYSQGYSDYQIYIQKLNASGNFVWAKSMGAESDDIGSSITLDNFGNIYSTGNFKSTADFNPGDATTNLVANGNADVYIQKLDTAGNFIWAKSFGSKFNDFTEGITVDASGNVLTTGRFSDTIDVDPSASVFKLNTTSYTDYDFFVHKLDKNGNFLWAKSVGDYDNDFSRAIATDKSNHVYVTGYYIGKPDFNPGPEKVNLGAGSGSFFLKLDSLGDFKNAINVAGASDHSMGMTIDTAGNLYATGYFMGTVDFDPSANVVNLTAIGYSIDLFVTKWNQDAPTGIADHVATSRFISIAPNPAKDKTVLTISNLQSPQVFQLTILNSYGQIVKQMEINTINTNIDLKNLCAGLYFYQVHTDDTTATIGKFIVE